MIWQASGSLQIIMESCVVRGLSGQSGFTAYCACGIIDIIQESVWGALKKSYCSNHFTKAHNCIWHDVQLLQMCHHLHCVCQQPVFCWKHIRESWLQFYCDLRSKPVHSTQQCLANLKIFMFLVCFICAVTFTMYQPKSFLPDPGCCSRFSRQCTQACCSVHNAEAILFITEKIA